ncbi:GNAT family N-acetyltransferase [Actinoplanes sp. NPDC051346]|uniref:GNAT family N-acetyltransferase n=1 Tax=Actinoplanes sp. NPDC051346 TaxID=3155048 RepID=UPI0034398421
MDEVTYKTVCGADARRYLPALIELYAEVYAEPPYCEGPEHVDQFKRWINAEVSKDGFKLVLALIAEEIAGAAYGFTIPPGEWIEPAASPPPADLNELRKFSVAEWMVRSRYRGAGIGRRLLDSLLDGRSEAIAILASNPAALARRVYERWGWQKKGSITPRTMPEMDVLVRPIATSRSE